MNTERSNTSSLTKDTKVNGNGRKITANTVVPIGAAIFVLGALLTGAQWLDSRLDAQDMCIQELRQEVQAVKILAEDRWRGSDMKLWTEMFLRQNPSLDGKVPDPWLILERRKK